MSLLLALYMIGFAVSFAWILARAVQFEPLEPSFLPVFPSLLLAFGWPVVVLSIIVEKIF